MSRRAHHGIYRTSIGGSTTLLLTEPDLIREAFVAHGERLSKGAGAASPWVRELLGNGVLTSEGEVHRRQRRLVAPAFSARRVRQHGERIVARARDRVRSWTPGTTIDVGAEMASLALEVAAESLFGIDVGEGRAAALRRSLVAALDAYAQRTAAAGPTSAVDPVTHRARELDAFVADLIEARSAGSGGADILAALLAATDPGLGTPLRPAEVRDCVVDLLLAGTETTASTLTWALHLIATHSTHRDLLRAAVRGPAAAGDPPPLLRATLSETLRLYPPAWLLARTVLDPFALGDVDLDRGTTVLASPYAMHRDPRWFASPQTFDPGRWLRSTAGGPPPAAYIPFGVGGRSCLGEGLAWVELGAVLHEVTALTDLESVSGGPVGSDFATTLRPERPILMEVRG